MQLFLVFLSDGAPSDHLRGVCEHGVNVWQSEGLPRDAYGGGPLYRDKKGQMKEALQNCETAWQCRAELKELVNQECYERVEELGDLFGRDRMCIHTVAVRPPLYLWLGLSWAAL